MRAEGQIARGAVQRESTVGGPPSESLSEQYSLAKILGTMTVMLALAVLLSTS